MLGSALRTGGGEERWGSRALLGLLRPERGYAQGSDSCALFKHLSCLSLTCSLRWLPVSPSYSSLRDLKEPPFCPKMAGTRYVRWHSLFSALSGLTLSTSQSRQSARVSGNLCFRRSPGLSRLKFGRCNHPAGRKEEDKLSGYWRFRGRALGLVRNSHLGRGPVVAEQATWGFL